jgi:hypothetical protein
MKLSLPAMALSTTVAALLGFGAVSVAMASVPAETSRPSDGVSLNELSQLLQFADNDSDDDSGQVGEDDDGAAINCQSTAGEDGEGAEGGEGGDDDGGAGCLPAPAPAGTVAPPANGLFNGTTAPKVKING